jgi:hypothetical protein
MISVCSFGDTVRRLKGRNRKHVATEFCDFLAIQLGVTLKLIHGRETLKCPFEDPMSRLDDSMARTSKAKPALKVHRRLH